MQHATCLDLDTEEPAGTEHYPNDVEKENQAEGDQSPLTRPVIDHVAAPKPLVFSLDRRVKYPEYSQGEDRDQEPHVDRVRATSAYQSLKVIPRHPQLDQAQSGRRSLQQVATNLQVTGWDWTFIE